MTFYGRSHRFQIDGPDAVGVATVTDIDGLGNEGEVYLIPMPDGSREPVVVAVQAQQITLLDVQISNAKWFGWLMRSLAGTDDSKQDLRVLDTDVGSEWTIIGARVIREGTAFSRGTDGLAANQITLVATRVERTGANCGDQPGAPITAVLGDIVLSIPGNARRQIEAQYSSAQAAGIEGDASQWVGSKGRAISLPFHIRKEGDKSADDILSELEALVLKDPEGPAPKIVAFSFGGLSLPAVVVRSLEVEELHRGRDGKLLLAKGTLALQERHVPGTARTAREEKGLRMYEVIGPNETWHSIAYRELQDERLWRAIADWNASPRAAGPCLDAGAVIAIPPWEFVQDYAAADNGGFAWL